MSRPPWPALVALVRGAPRYSRRMAVLPTSLFVATAPGRIWTSWPKKYAAAAAAGRAPITRRRGCAGSRDRSSSIC
jgi:hypothetical protein